MFRVTFSRALAIPRTASFLPVIAHTKKPAVWQAIRHNRNASGPGNPWKQALEAKDALQRDWDAKVLAYEELKPRTLQPRPDTFLIDVREPDEVLQGSIPSSVNLPLSVLSGSLHLPPEEFEKKFGFPLPKKDQEIIFYCRSGVRSTSACDVAKRNGYTNILNYKGSWLEWVGKEGKST